MIAGHCYGSYWAQLGESAPIPESAILMLGVRDLDPAESERLDHSAIHVVKWHDGQPQSNAQTALDRLAQRVPEGLSPYRHGFSRPGGCAGCRRHSGARWDFLGVYGWIELLPLLQFPFVLACKSLSIKWHAGVAQFAAAVAGSPYLNLKPNGIYVKK